MMTKEDHLNWAKQRAFVYVDDDNLIGAFFSFQSDLKKHPKLKNHYGAELSIMLLASGKLNTRQAMREHIEGFK